MGIQFEEPTVSQKRKYSSEPAGLTGWLQRKLIQLGIVRNTQAAEMMSRALLFALFILALLVTAFNIPSSQGDPNIRSEQYYNPATDPDNTS